MRYLAFKPTDLFKIRSLSRTIVHHIQVKTLKIKKTGSIRWLMKSYLKTFDIWKTIFLKKMSVIKIDNRHLPDGVRLMESLGRLIVDLM